MKNNLIFITGIAILLSGVPALLKGTATTREDTAESQLIFPTPLDLKINGGKFKIDRTTFILGQEKSSKSDDFLSGLIFNELVDKYKLPVTIIRKSAISDKDKFILIGDLINPLVKSYCEKNGFLASLKTLGSEGYILSVTGNSIVVASNTGNGALFGYESLRQILKYKEMSYMSELK